MTSQGAARQSWEQRPVGKQTPPLHCPALMQGAPVAPGVVCDDDDDRSGRE